MSDARYLLDTNVISEGRRRRPDANVVSFLRSVPPAQTFVSVLTVGELRKGAAQRRRSNRDEGNRIDAWIDEVEALFADRILPIDLAVARLWGAVSAVRPMPLVDTLLAATALVRNLVLVTRNTRDITGIEVEVLNPWKQEP